MLPDLRQKTFRGLRTSWYEGGPADAPLLLFLHGYPDGPDIWERQIEHFQDRFQVLAPFTRGAALSEAGHKTGRYSFRSSTLDYLQLLNDKDPTRKLPVVVVGHDLGAVHAWHLSSFLGKRLAGLVSLNGGPLLQMAQRLSQLRQHRKSWYIYLMQLPTIPEFAAKKFGKKLISYAYKKGELSSVNQPEPDTSVAVETVNQYRAFLRELPSVLKSPPPPIEAPVLVLWGENDAFLEPPTRSELDSLATDVTIRIIEGNHWVFREDPARVNRILDTFLRSVALIDRRNLYKKASKLPALPLLNRFAPAVNHIPSDWQLSKYRTAQRLAQKAVSEVAALMEEGWTERQAAETLNTYLRDHGVKSFFHEGFAWFGERAGFDGITEYKQFMPTDRRLQENEIFILDVAPIVNGYVCDIGYTHCHGENQELKNAKDLLKDLREETPALFESGKTGGEIWTILSNKITDAGYTNAHAKYPFSVIGHRVHQVPSGIPHLKLLRFGWQSFYSLFSRGLLGQLLNENFEGDLTGLWAVEPHLGGPGFGAKFEEILVVTPEGTRWLDDSFGL